MANPEGRTQQKKLSFDKWNLYNLSLVNFNDMLLVD